MTTLEQDRTTTEGGTTGAAAADRAISGLDRCDSCSAQAYVRVLLNGSELLFCAHHARKHEAKLRDIATVWHDETHKLD